MFFIRDYIIINRCYCRYLYSSSGISVGRNTTVRISLAADTVMFPV